MRDFQHKGKMPSSLSKLSSSESHRQPSSEGAERMLAHPPGQERSEDGAGRAGAQRWGSERPNAHKAKAGELSLNFDEVVISRNGKDESMTPDEFMAIPLGDRVKLLTTSRTVFLMEGQRISPLDALRRPK